MTVTGLLLQWGQGDEAALERLIPLVYRELHQIARRCMAGERGGHSLQATALVNEAYLRLVDAKTSRGTTARISSRCLLRSCAASSWTTPALARRRSEAAARRRVTFDEALLVDREPGQDFVALDDALEALATFDERKSRVIELRFFGGLSVEETASVLNVSPDTVMRDWRLAKAWLQREMRGESAHDA